MTPSDVFLSYHRSDRELVDKVWQILNARGVSTFVDYKNLIPGLPWPRALEQALGAVRAVAVFVGPELGLWQAREMDYALERQTEEERAGRGFPVIPVLLPGAAITSGFLFRNTWVDLREDSTSADALNQLLKALQGETPPQNAANLAALCPYRALKAFREEHAAFFFGREQISKRLLDKVLREPGLVAVIGPSGSGKSSIAHCGLLPLLRRQRPPAKAWDAISFTPGDRPFHRLARSLIPLMLAPEASDIDRLTEAKKLGDHLAAGDVEIGSIAELIIEKSKGTDRLLVIVDQFEEIFTLAPEKDRKSFVKSLVGVLGRAPLEFVVTLRADYCGHVIALSRELSDRLEQSIVNVGPMTRNELESAIVEPAKKIGLSFEPGLTDRLLNDVGDEPGNLPLLEFALTELWAQRQGQSMTHAAYTKFGGLTRAMSSRAGAELSKLSPEERAAVRQIFTRLVRIAAPGHALEDTRQRVLLDELGDAARPFVDRLAEARLLVTARDDNNRETVEVSHEALIQGWTDLQAWLNEDREFLLWRQRLRLSLMEWRHAERDEGGLLRGALLTEAERWWTDRARDLNEEEREFIGASVDHRQKQILEEEGRRREEEVRRKRRVRNLVLGMAAVSVLAAFALLQWNRAVSQGRAALARGLLSRAILTTNTQPSRFDQAALLAIESLKLERTPEGEAILREAFALLPKEINPPWQMDCAPESATFSYGGRFLACVNNTTGTAKIIAVAAGEERIDLPVAEYTKIRKLETSPDGKLLGIGLRGGFKLYDTGPPGPKVISEVASSEAEGADTVVTFSGNGKYFAAALFDPGMRRTTIHLYSIADAVLSRPFQTENRILALTFSADGGVLAALHDGEISTKVAIFDVAGKKSLETIDGGAAIASLALSKDASWIATPELDSVLVTDRASQQVYRLSHEKRPNAVALSEDGLYAASGGEDGVARVVEATTDRLIALIPTGSPVKAVAFTADNNLVLVSQDRTVRTVNVLDRLAFESLPIGIKGISPNGRYLTTFTGGAAPELAIVDRQTAKKPLKQPVERQTFPIIASDPGDLRDLVQSLLVSGIVRYSFDEQYLVATSGDYGMTAFELNTRKAHHEPAVPGIVAEAISGDGKVAAWATARDIQILGANDGARRAAPLEFSAARALELSADGGLVAASSTTDRLLVVFDVAARKEIFRREMESVVIKVAFSPDGSYLAASSENKDLALVDLRTGAIIRLEDVETTLLLFSSDGSILAAGGGRQIQRLRTDGPEGEFPFAVPLIETATGKVLSTIQIAREAVGAAFSPGNGYLEVVDETSLTRHYVRTEDLIEQTCTLLNRNLRQDEWNEWRIMSGSPNAPTCRR